MAARNSTNKPATSGMSSELAELTQDNNKKVEHLDQRRKSLADEYMQEEKVMVQGAPMYKAYFGHNMGITVNGIYIAVPLDGNRYEIPVSFAQVFNERLRRVNLEIEQQRVLADVSSNAESYVGERSLVTPV